MNKNCTSIKTCEEKRKLLFEKDGYNIFSCERCSLTFTEIKDTETHVEKVYSDEYFFEGKAGYPNYLIEKDLLYNYGLRYAKIISRYIKPGSLLDIGCAAGFIMKGFEDASWKVNGIEPNNTMAAYGRENLNLDIQTGSFENFTTTNKFDLVTMIQVIGHFYDIDKALLRIKSLLKQDGLVLVESWNKDSLVAKMMGKNWHEYSPPSVVNWFSDETLAGLFSSYGFRLVAKGYPPKKISIKHAISLLKEKSPDFFLVRKFYSGLERLVGKLNINYPPLDVKWYLFKQEG